jgi:hypothetical protein
MPFFMDVALMYEVTDNCRKFKQPCNCHISITCMRKRKEPLLPYTALIGWL